MSSRDGLLALGAGVAGGLVALAAQKLLRREATIARFGMPNPRAAAAVVHNGTVYLSGQVGIVDKDGTLKGLSGRTLKDLLELIE